MRKIAGDDKEIYAYQGPVYPGDLGGPDDWHGIEYVNHPTPSGSPRYLPSVSDKRAWPTREQAIDELKKLLNPKKKVTENGQGQ